MYESPDASGAEPCGDAVVPGDAGDTDDAVVVGAITACTREKAIAAFHQFEAIADLVELRLPAAGEGKDPRQWWLCDGWTSASAEVAAAGEVGMKTASALMHTAVALRYRLPQVAALLAQGRISEKVATMITWRTALITEDTVSVAVDTAVARSATTLGPMPVGEAEKVVDRCVADHDPDAVRRAREAARGRGVWLGKRGDPSGVVSLYGALLARDAAAVDRKLSSMISSVCVRDPRGVDQRRSEAMGALADGRPFLECACGRADCDAPVPDSTGSTTVIYVVAEPEALTADTDSTIHDNPHPRGHTRGDGDGARDSDGQGDGDEPPWADIPVQPRSVAEPMTAPDPVAQPAAEPVTEQTVEDVDEQATEPVVEAVVEPGTETAAAPATGATESTTPSERPLIDPSAKIEPPQPIPSTPPDPREPDPTQSDQPEPGHLPSAEEIRPRWRSASEKLAHLPVRPPEPVHVRATGIIVGGGLIPAYQISDLVRAGAKVRPLKPITHWEPEPHHTPSPALAALIRARDLHCRFPHCTVPADRCDIDHVIPWPDGPTHPSNLDCKCRTHHLLKTFWIGLRGWSDVLLPDGTAIWTSPSGRTYTTTPGSRLFFPALTLNTGTLPTAAPAPPSAYRDTMMPKRRTTRKQQQRNTIEAERNLNRKLREAEEADAKAKADAEAAQAEAEAEAKADPNAEAA